MYLPAIKGFVPPEMLKCIRFFLDFCYLARRADLNEDTLDELDQALQHFHEHRSIFQTSDVRPDGFNLPRQHSLIHYRRNIEDYGAPNGLCSSITESRHITAVKRPWRRSNRHKALGQMLGTNQRLDKLKAARADFISRGMLPPDRLPPPQDHEDAEDGDEGPAEGEQVLGNVTLARTRGVCVIIILLIILLANLSIP